MKTSARKTYCVLTGDVVGSTDLDRAARRRLHDTMKRAGADLRSLLGAAMPLDVDIFRGDSWQLLLTTPSVALRAALFYRASVIAHAAPVDTRVAMAVGAIDFVPSDRVSEGEGPAFRMSGRLLESDRARRLAFAAPGRAPLAPWDVVFRLLDDIIVNRWTAKRALAVTGALRGWKQARIARLWRPRISQPSVGKHLKGASWDAVESTLAAFEAQLPGDPPVLSLH